VLVWLSGNIDACINKVILHQDRLVLRWVTIRRYIILVCNQPLGPTQPPTLSWKGKCQCFRREG